MNFYVIGPDGTKYGPADLATLNSWISQNRLLPDSVLENAADGTQSPASQVPGLNFGRPVTPSEPSAPQSQPQSPYSQPGPSSNPYAQPGPSSSPYANYPRGGSSVSYGTDLPAELKGKFNWGAFFMTWIWGLNHKAYLTLISLAVGGISGGLNVVARQGGGGSGAISGIVGLANLGLMIFYGIKGYEWAWQSGRFATPEECKKCQTIWGWWGLGIQVGCCVLCGIALAGIIGAAATQMH